MCSAMNNYFLTNFEKDHIDMQLLGLSLFSKYSIQKSDKPSTHRWFAAKSSSFACILELNSTYKEIFQHH